MEIADAKEHPGTSGSEHHSCLTSHINQHPQAPESFGGTKKVISPCVVDSHDISENTEELYAESSGEWPAFWLSEVSLLPRLFAEHRGQEGNEALKRKVGSRDRVWGSKEGRALKTSKFY